MGLDLKGFTGDLTGSGARPGKLAYIIGLNFRGVRHQGFLNFGPRQRVFETRNMAHGFKAIGSCIVNQAPWKYLKGSSREASRKYVIRYVVLR